VREQDLSIAICGPADPRELFNGEEVESAPYGQGGRPVNALAKALASKGVKVQVVSLSKDISKTWSHTEGNLTLHLVPMRSRVRSQVLDFYKEEKTNIAILLNTLSFDLVHFHWTYEYALAAKFIDKPKLITVHDAPLRILRFYKDLFRLFRLVVAIKVRLCNSNFTFVSPALKSKWRKEMLCFRDFPVIPNISLFHPIDTISAKRSGNRVLIVANSQKLKNVKGALLAWNMVVSRIPNASLTLVGDGLGKNDELAKWAESKNIQISIAWMGTVTHSEIRELMMNSDIFLHPSLEESFGMSILEAMQYGLPVVAGENSGGARYVLGDAGYLIDTRNQSEIGNALIKLMSDEQLKESLGQTALFRAKSNFNSDFIVESYINEYKRLITI
jgi:glycosyltransferase involved in cell wall biosynthesis